MPLVRIAFREGRPAQYRQAVANEVHRALADRLAKNPGVRPEDLVVRQRQGAVRKN